MGYRCLFVSGEGMALSSIKSAAKAHHTHNLRFSMGFWDFWGANFNRSYPHRIHGTGIFTYVWLIFMANVGKYTIHGSYGITSSYPFCQLFLVGGFNRPEKYARQI